MTTPTDDEPVPVWMIATCRTPGCPMEGVGCRAPMYSATTPPNYQAYCAQCEQRVTDLVPDP